MSTPEEKVEQGYKRVHFFKIRLTEDDWNERHEYHVQKAALHSYAAHAFGVVPYEKKELRVVERSTPDMTIEIQAGYALDRDGTDMVVPEAQLLEIPRDEVPLPGMIYIVIRSKVEPVKFVRFKSGRREHRYEEERFEVTYTTEKPARNEVELARIYLSVGVRAIKNAEDVDRPKPNEIDMRFKPWAWVVERVQPNAKKELVEAIVQRREAFRRMMGNPNLRPAFQGVLIMSVLKLLVENMEMPPGNILEVVRTMAQTDLDICELIRTQSEDPWVLERPEYLDYYNSVQLIFSLLRSDRFYLLENFDQLMRYVGGPLEPLLRAIGIYGNESLVYYEGQECILPKTYEMGTDWERLKIYSAQFPERIIIDGIEWTQIASIEVANEQSERQHKFAIKGAKDFWRARQNVYYPDGVQIDDVGVSHQGGHSEYELRNVLPDTHLAIVRMMDYVRADYEMEIYCNGQLVGISECKGYDRQFRWRNWPFVIPAFYVNDDTVRIRQVPIQADRDINMFKYWFFQPLSGM